MILLQKVLCSWLFWVDVILSVTGGLIVYWGLKIEKDAERRLPPDDFNPDIFENVVSLLKKEIEKGWRILMIGIALEVVAALGVCIISGFEVAASNERSEKLEKDAEELRKANLKLYAQIQPRRITPEMERTMTNFFKSFPEKGTVELSVDRTDMESVIFLCQIAKVLNESGFKVETNDTIAGTIAFGVWFEVENNNPAPSQAWIILNGFKAANLPFKVKVETNRAVGSFEIWIGAKPFPE